MHADVRMPAEASYGASTSGAQARHQRGSRVWVWGAGAATHGACTYAPAPTRSDPGASWPPPPGGRACCMPRNFVCK
uniref:Uncharacterized protein n=1 Tax=Oryza sativa subsp. japonica TaxID=39947 RepID=Q67X74_ORYSJ|nr:hypothetical protein [Oryza sativa Japonica Group]